MKSKAWTVVLIGFLAGVALALVQNKVAPSILFLMEDLKINMATAGWLSSIFNLMGMVMAIPSAFILNRLGAKMSGIIALSAALVGSLIGAFTESVAILFFSRVVEGLGVGLISVIGPTLVSMWFPPSRRGLPMGIWGTWQVVSQAVVFFTGSYITRNYGWQGVWWFCFVVCVIAVVLYAWKVTNPPSAENYAEKPEGGTVSFIEGFKSVSTWLVSIIFVLFCISAYGFATWIAPYWAETFNWDISEANKWVGYLCFFSIFVGVGVGWLLDKLSKQRKLVGMVALCLYGILVYFCFTMKNPALVLPIVVIYAIIEGTIPTALFTISPQTVKDPALAGLALGIISLGLNLGMIVGPPIMGAVVDSYGWSAGGMVLMLTSVLGMALLFLVKIHNQQAH